MARTAPERAYHLLDEPPGAPQEGTCLIRRPPYSARLLPTGLRVVHSAADWEDLTLLAESEVSSLLRPLCNSRSGRIRSRYTRTASDLPRGRGTVAKIEVPHPQVLLRYHATVTRMVW